MYIFTSISVSNSSVCCVPYWYPASSISIAFPVFFSIVFRKFCHSISPIVMLKSFQQWSIHICCRSFCVLCSPFWSTPWYISSLTSMKTQTSILHPRKTWRWTKMEMSRVSKIRSQFLMIFERLMTHLRWQFVMRENSFKNHRKQLPHITNFCQKVCRTHKSKMHIFKNVFRFCFLHYAILSYFCVLPSFQTPPSQNIILFSFAILVIGKRKWTQNS